MLRAREAGARLGSHVVHVGVLGFVFVLPVVLGGLAGQALARRWERPLVAVACILIGVAIGAVASWRQIQRGLDPPGRGPGERS